MDVINNNKKINNMCYTCGTDSCNCGNSIDISKIKGKDGNNGADSTVPGPAGPIGVGVVSIIPHTTLPNIWVITYTNGTTQNISAPTTGSDTYFAWADDNIGTGFTTTPSDKLYLGITDTLATPGTPVVGDFTGTWFLINQPKLRYETASYLGLTETINTTAGIFHNFTPALPILSVPAAYFNSASSYIEYNLDFDFIHSGISPNSNIDLNLDINGVLIDVGNLSPGPFNSYANLTVKVYYESSTSIRAVSYLTIDNTGSTTQQVEKINNVVTITAGSNINITLKQYRHDAAFGDMKFNSHNIQAFNPNKLTIV